MILTIRCKKCGKAIVESVNPGYNLDKILSENGFDFIGESYYCEDHSHSIAA